MVRTSTQSLPIATRVVFDLWLPVRRPLLTVIVLHEYGSTCARMLDVAREFTPSDYGIISVQGPHQHTRVSRRTGKSYAGYGWGTTEDLPFAVNFHHNALRKVINWAIGEGFACRGRIVLVGFSEPVPLNYGLAASDGVSFLGLLAFCGTIPALVEPRRLPTILHIAGSSDPVAPYSNAAFVVARMQSAGVQVSFKVHEGAHEITKTMKNDACDWLASLAKAKAKKGTLRALQARSSTNEETIESRNRSSCGASAKPGNLIQP
jgi:predicted esterase